MRKGFFLAAVFLLTICVSGISSASAKEAACQGIDRSLAEVDRQKLEPIVGEQTQLEDVDILESYQLEDWHILYVDAPEIDPAYLFYSGDPSGNEFIWQWNGAVRMNKVADVRAWVDKHMPTMPEKLADCFAARIVADKQGTTVEPGAPDPAEDPEAQSD